MSVPMLGERGALLMHSREGSSNAPKNVVSLMRRYIEECPLVLRILLHSGLRWVFDGLLNLNFFS